MVTLYLVRHGQCESNLGSAFQGQIDSPLTDLGRRQAQCIADRLASEEIAAIYSSDLSRARDTAEAIASRHGLPVNTTPLLREASMGAVQGMAVAQFEELYPAECRNWRLDPIANRPPGAERFEEVIARCGLFIEEAKAKHSAGDKIVAAVHVGSHNGLICAAFSLPVTFYLGMHAANASLSVLEVGEKPFLRVVNDACHLSSICVTF